MFQSLTIDSARFREPDVDWFRFTLARDLRFDWGDRIDVKKTDRHHPSEVQLEIDGVDDSGKPGPAQYVSRVVNPEFWEALDAALTAEDDRRKELVDAFIATWNALGLPRNFLLDADKPTQLATLNIDKGWKISQAETALFQIFRAENVLTVLSGQRTLTALPTEPKPFELIRPKVAPLIQAIRELKPEAVRAGWNELKPPDRYLLNAADLKIQLRELDGNVWTIKQEARTFEAHVEDDSLTILEIKEKEVVEPWLTAVPTPTAIARC